MSIFKKTDQKVRVSSRVVLGVVLSVVVIGGALLYLTYPRNEGLKEISRVINEIDNDNDDDDDGCGPGTFQCGEGCCPSDTTCCGGDACCSEGYECKSSGVPLLGTVSWCHKTECEEEEFRCGEGDRGICCANGTACVAVDLGRIKGTVYRCGSEQCEPGQSACGDPDDQEGGRICCDSNEACINISGVPACKAQTCDSDSGEYLCNGGDGRYEDLAICCPSDTTCIVHPNGFPQCR